jgi:hypothetical protein
VRHDGKRCSEVALRAVVVHSPAPTFSLLYRKLSRPDQLSVPKAG